MVRRTRLLRLLAATTALLAAGFAWLPGRPPAAGPPAPARRDGPQLQNSSFEGSFNPWEQWAVVQGSDCLYQQPTFIILTIFGDDPLHVIEGHDAARISIEGGNSYWAGLRQRVGNATPGMLLEFSVELQMDSTIGANKNPSPIQGEPNMRVGIDPTGGESVTSGDIVWSPPENRLDNYYRTSVQTVARAGDITVYISSHPSVCQDNADTFIDRASLDVLGMGQVPSNTPVVTATNAASAAPTTAPTNTNPPGPQFSATPLLTPTPGEDGTIIYVVQPGDTLTAIAFAAGTTVQQLQSLNGLTGGNILVGQRLILATAAPTETPAPTATETAAPSPTAQPTAAPSPTPVDPAGQVCVAMYEDEDADGAHDTSEALLAGGTLRLRASGNPAPIAEYQTTGAGEPYCFERLEPKTYLVAAAGPEGYAVTKTDEIGVLLPPQGRVNLEFGAQRQAPNFTGILAAAGAVILLAAGGSAAYIWRRRSQAA